MFENTSPDCPKEHSALPAGNKVATAHCGICGRMFRIDLSPHRPFCSRRCQEIDLGRWMGEEYGLPWEDPGQPGPDPESPD